MITEQDLDSWFATYADLSNSQIEKINIINHTARAFVETILEGVPQSADQTAAIRKIREATMTVIHIIQSEG